MTVDEILAAVYSTPTSSGRYPHLYVEEGVVKGVRVNGLPAALRTAIRENHGALVEAFRTQGRTNPRVMEHRLEHAMHIIWPMERKDRWDLDYRRLENAYEELVLHYERLCTTIAKSA